MTSKTQKYEVYRHGDVNLIRLSEDAVIPKEMKAQAPTKRGVVLALGEQTGHAHLLSPTVAKRYEVGKDTDYQSLGINIKEYQPVAIVEIKKDTTLVHDAANPAFPPDHDPIDLPKGLYAQVQAREHTPAGVRAVYD